MPNMERPSARRNIYGDWYLPRQGRILPNTMTAEDIEALGYEVKGIRQCPTPEETIRWERFLDMHRPKVLNIILTAQAVSE